MYIYIYILTYVYVVHTAYDGLQKFEVYVAEGPPDVRQPYENQAVQCDTTKSQCNYIGQGCPYIAI